MNQENVFDSLVQEISKDDSIPENHKRIVFQNLAKLKNTKVNLLIVGATGCGKSSTINALFNTNKAKVGQGVDPETMKISKYELNNIIVHDSPGLGDGKEADIRHAKAITKLLHERDDKNNLLIDLALVILDGGSRDLGTSFEIINSVIIPALGSEISRLLVAINQADVAMKGRHWNDAENRPEPPLEKFLDDKVISTKNRIKETTGIDVDVIYYAAGYKDGNQDQRPYNLSKLFAFILRHTKKEKRAVFANDINTQKSMWTDDDRLGDYRAEIKQSMWESIKENASSGADIGGEIGKIFGAKGEAIGRAAGALGGAIVGVFKSIF